MKIIKRILAVVLLITTVTLVGYFVYTGSRFSFTGEDYRELIGNTYTNQGISMTFNEDNSIGYKTDTKTIKMLDNEVIDGVIVCNYDGNEYRFVVITADNIYDVSQKRLLRRAGYE